MDRNCPLFRYWSMRSGFLSRRNTRSSTSGLPSTSLKSTGTLYRASPHQSSVMTMTLSFLPRRVRAVLSSGLILISERNFMNVSLLVPIWSRYCWTVIPCANRSFVSIRSPRRRLSHRGEIDGELRHFLLLGVPHHQGHPALRVDGVGGKRVHALSGIATVPVAEGGALVLHEARLHGLRAHEDLRSVVAREVRLPAPQGDPEGELALRVFEDVVTSRGLSSLLWKAELRAARASRWKGVITTAVCPAPSFTRHSAPNSSVRILFLPARIACSRSRSVRTTDIDSPGVAATSPTAKARNGRHRYREALQPMRNRILAQRFRGIAGAPRGQ